MKLRPHEARALALDYYFKAIMDAAQTGLVSKTFDLNIQNFEDEITSAGYKLTCITEPKEDDEDFLKYKKGTKKFTPYFVVSW